MRKNCRVSRCRLGPATSTSSQAVWVWVCAGAQRRTEDGHDEREAEDVEELDGVHDGQAERAHTHPIAHIVRQVATRSAAESAENGLIAEDVVGCEKMSFWLRE